MSQDFTTFWTDFTVADAFGKNAVIDTYNRAFNEWKNNYKYLTYLVLNLNHKIWQHYEQGSHDMAKLYDSLWRQADSYAIDNLTDEELQYYLSVLD